MECLKLQEDEAASGSKDLSCIVYKGHMKSHSRYSDKLTQKIEEDEVDDDVNLANLSMKSGLNRTHLSN